MSENFEDAIAKCVDNIWAEYDKDGSGKLNKEETKAFVKFNLSCSGEEEFPDEEYEACFAEFDKNGSGTIEKDEMAAFIKKVAGM